MVRKHFGWAAQVGASGTDNVTTNIYVRFVQFLVSAIYVLSVNSRVQAIMDLRIRQLREIFDEDSTEAMTTSTCFKTSATYKQQPITIAQVCVVNNDHFIN